jgi:hypothetical protein
VGDSTGSGADSYAARQTTHDISHIPGCLLIAYIDEPQSIPPAGNQQRIEAIAAQYGEEWNTVRFELSHHQISSRHGPFP